jgi:hypothetical protein
LVVKCLLFFAKSLTMILLVCVQFLTLGVLQLLAAALFAYLVFFPSRSSSGFTGVPATLFVTQAISALLLISWAGASFLSGEHDHNSQNLILLWLAMALALPVAPFNPWFEQLLRKAPTVVSLAVILFLAALLFRFLQIGEVIFVETKESLHGLMVWAGFVVGALSLVRAYSIREGRALFATAIQFFIGMALVAYGFSSEKTFQAGLVLSMLIPLFASILISLEFDGLTDRKQMPLVLGFLVLLVGFPGTAIFTVWAFLGERALDLGGVFPILLGVLWLFYLLINLLYFREILSVSNVKQPSVSTRAPIWVQSAFMLVFMAATWGATILGGNLF